MGVGVGESIKPLKNPHTLDENLFRLLYFRFRHFQTVERTSKLDFFFRHLPFAIVVSIQVICAYFFLLAYGTLAFFLGPLRTWSIILALILWRSCNNLKENSFRYGCLHILTYSKRYFQTNQSLFSPIILGKQVKFG